MASKGKELQVGYVRILAEGRDFADSFKKIVESVDAAGVGEHIGREIAQGLAKGLDKASTDLDDHIGEWEDDAEKLGEKSGEGFGEGFEDGVKKKLPADPLAKPLKDTPKKQEESGEKAGNFFTKAFTKSLAKVQAHSDKIFAGLAASAAAAGTAVTASIVGAVSQESASDKMAASLGLDPKTQKIYGKTAGNIYAEAYGESLEQVNEAMASVASSFPDIGVKELEESTKLALNFAETFDVDVQSALNSAQAMVKSGLAPNIESALDSLTTGMQKTPMAIRDELLSATEEYSQFAASVGMTHDEMIGGMTEMTKLGMYGIDKYGDSIKEFTILSTEMSKSTVQAFKSLGYDGKEDSKMLDSIAKMREKAAAKLSKIDVINGNAEIAKSKIDPKAADATAQKVAIGLDAKKQTDLLKSQADEINKQAEGMVKSLEAPGKEITGLANKIIEGGKKSGPAMQEIARRILEIKDPAQQAETAIALFGTPLEDLGKKNIPDFLKSLAEGSKSLEGFEGSTAKAGETLRDNAKTNIDVFMRSVKQGFIETIGNQVIPKITEWSEKLSGVGKWFKENPKAIERFAKVAVGAAALVAAAWTVNKVAGGVKQVSAAITNVTSGAKWIKETAIARKETAKKIALRTKEGAIAVANAVKHTAAYAAQSAKRLAIATKEFLKTTALYVKSTAVRVAALATQAAAWVAATAAMVAHKVALVAMAAAQKAATAAQWLLNAALTANPIGLVVAAVVALGVAVVVAYKKSETFRKIVQGAWEGIKKAATWAWDALKVIFKVWTYQYKLLWMAAVKAKDILVGAWNAIKDAVGAAAGFVKSKVNNLINAFTSVPEKLKNATSSFLEAGKDLGKKVIDGIKDGLTGAADFVGDMAGSVWEAVKALINKGIDSINGALEFKIDLGFKEFKVNPKDIPHLASGGHVWASGASSRWNADDIWAKLTKGEFVIQQRAVKAIDKKFPGALDYMNRHGNLPGFASGGPVSPVIAIPSASGTARGNTETTQQNGNRNGPLIGQAVFQGADADEIMNEFDWRIRTARYQGVYALD